MTYSNPGDELIASLRALRAMYAEKTCRGCVDDRHNWKDRNGCFHLEKINSKTRVCPLYKRMR